MSGGGVVMLCSFGSAESICAPFNNQSTIVPLSKCTLDMSSHLTGLGVSAKRTSDDNTILSEVDLILNRSGRFDEDPSTLTICAKHRRDLTLDWPGRKSSACCYPNHKALRKQLKSSRRVNASMSVEIHRRFNLVVPIGSGKTTHNATVLSFWEGRVKISCHPCKNPEFLRMLH